MVSEVMARSPIVVLLLAGACPITAACGARTDLGTRFLDAEASDVAPIDASPVDVAQDVLGDVIGFDADAGTIVCGDASCNANAQFCEHGGGGPPPGFSEDLCRTLPSGCHACDCLPPPYRGADGCNCKDTSGQIVVVCNFP